MSEYLTVAERTRLAKSIMTASYMSVGFAREYGHDVAKLLGVVDALQTKLFTQETVADAKLKELEGYWKDRIGRIRYIKNIAHNLAESVVETHARAKEFDTHGRLDQNYRILLFAKEILSHSKHIDEQENFGG